MKLGLGEAPRRSRFLASQQGSNTGTSDAIHKIEYVRVVEEHYLGKIMGLARWNGEKEREGEERHF